MQPNNLCSLRPVIAYVVLKTLDTCNDFSETIEKVIQFPKPLAPDFKLYARGYYGEKIIGLSDTIENCKWWDE
jgi:hypothetical protein